LGSLIAGLTPLGVQLTKRALQVNTDAPGLAAAMELETRFRSGFRHDRGLFVRANRANRPPSAVGQFERGDQTNS
jgi:hypothetical protein